MNERDAKKAAEQIYAVLLEEAKRPNKPRGSWTTPQQQIDMDALGGWTRDGVVNMVVGILKESRTEK